MYTQYHSVDLLLEEAKDGEIPAAGGSEDEEEDPRTEERPPEVTHLCNNYALGLV